MEPVMATCPECDFDEIDTEDFEEGDTLSCPECGKSLVLVGPDELESADDDDDDLDDDEEDDDLAADEDEDALDDDDEDEEEEELDE
jgi:alpha-aminoadipate/glutamate carrier protein LysW